MDKKQLKKDMPGYEALWGKYSAFRSRGNLAPEWSDFWAFYNWVIDHGWEPGTNIIVDWTRLIGPDNCLLKVTVRRAMPENNADAPPVESIKGGYKNSPCIGCPNDSGKGCPSYANCPKYAAWVAASWDQFNAYARKYGCHNG